MFCRIDNDVGTALVRLFALPPFPRTHTISKLSFPKSSFEPEDHLCARQQEARNSENHLVANGKNGFGGVTRWVQTAPGKASEWTE